jgi:hypothetical protein
MDSSHIQHQERLPVGHERTWMDRFWPGTNRQGSVLDCPLFGHPGQRTQQLTAHECLF